MPGLTNNSDGLSFGTTLVFESGVGSGTLIIGEGTPPPPVPPGPADVLVETADGMDGTTIPFTSETGIVIVRLCGASHAAGSVPSVTWNGDDLDLGAFQEATVDGCWAALFYIKGGHIGSGNVVVSTTGAMGYGAVRAGDVAALDDDPVGQIDAAYMNDYYWENYIPERTPDSTLAQIAVAPSPTAYELTADPYITIQWNTPVGVVATVGFGYTDAMNELYYVWFPRVAQQGLLLGVELKGLELV